MSELDETPTPSDGSQSANTSTLPSFTELFDQALSLYRAKWRSISLYAGIAFVLSLLQLPNHILNAAPQAATSTLPYQETLAFSVVALVAAFFVFWFNIATLDVIRQKEVKTFGATVRRAAKFYLSFALIYFEFGLIAVGFYVLQIVLPVLAVSAIFYAFILGSGSLLNSSADVILYILGAIYIAVRVFTSFSVAPWELLEGNHRGVRAFMASRAHVEGRFWSVWGRLILAGIVAAVAYGIVWAIALALSLAIPTQEIAMTVSSFVRAFFEQIVLLPMLFAFTFVLYEALRNRKPVEPYLQAHSPWPLRSIALFGLFGGIALFLSALYLTIQMAGSV